MLRKSLLVASLATAIFASPVMAQDAAPVEDRVLATINGEDILESEVRATQVGLPEQYRQYPFEALLPMLLDREINQRLMTIAATDAGLKDDAEVKERMAALERRVIAEIYLDRKIEEAVTEEALRARYDEFVKTNVPENTVHARHILLETEEDAKAVIAALDDGADFVELAQEKSTGPSGPTGGDLGFFARGEMVQPFADAAFDMEAGTYSKEPVQTQFGWHVIKVEETREGVQPTYEEQENQLAAELTQEVYLSLIEELRSGNDVVNTLDTPAEEDSSETPKE
ncbi:peptidylprolyl isomerase [Thalassospira sp.]|uniref:peptidylprolyl isomerase n=1 Tax=Thalassospira sp. TaxID=1912094 RepID=UPI0027343697|nr:peptidylprolyl isomerase [Thalassospira sp.]MDP2698882.1 peptidylprolyl isomerase [Thalassospira sp.]